MFVSTKNIYHNIFTQSEGKRKTLAYDKKEGKPMAIIISNLRDTIVRREECHAQHFLLKRGIKEFPSKGKDSALNELTQILQRLCFKPI